MEGSRIIFQGIHLEQMIAEKLFSDKKKIHTGK